VPQGPCSSRGHQATNLFDDRGDGQLVRRPDGVDQIDMVETHASQRAVQFGRGVLVGPMLPPQLVRHDDLVALPTSGAEELTEHDLGVAGRNRCGAGLIVVAGVIEKVDAGIPGRPHHVDTVVA
jgi:hypothetical protein